MKDIQFEWDEMKNALNKNKHGISFEEAASVFADPDALIIPDPDHSIEEDRFLILGFSLKLKLMVVCHCYRKADAVIRIISARSATRNEAKQYNSCTNKW